MRLARRRVGGIGTARSGLQRGEGRDSGERNRAPFSVHPRGNPPGSRCSPQLPPRVASVTRGYHRGVRREPRGLPSSRCHIVLVVFARTGNASVRMSLSCRCVNEYPFVHLGR